LTQKLYQHQKEGVVKFFEVEFGIVKFPTRTGKTMFASECIRLVNNQRPESKIFFIVDTSDLFEQAISDISDFLKIKTSDIGKIKGETIDIKQITVATIQTLQSILVSKRESKTKLARKKEIIRHLESVNFLIVDEIHESVNSKSRFSVIDKFKKLHWLLGLSATPYKGDEEEGSVEFLNNIQRKAKFGGIVFEVDSDLMKQRGILAKEKVLLIVFESSLSSSELNKLEIDSDSEKNKMNFYNNQLIYNDSRRNEVILIIIGLLRLKKFKTLTIFNSKKHGYNIERLSGEKFICGDHNTLERKEATMKFLRGVGKILLCSDIYKKGITLPQAEVLLNVNGGFEDNLIIQRKGRVAGTTKNKKNSLIIDIIDTYKTYYSEHSLNRLKVYEKHCSMENIDVIFIDNSELITFQRELTQYLDNYER
jgi:superfamily II DNA or RNA helicase